MVRRRGCVPAEGPLAFGPCSVEQWLTRSARRPAAARGARDARALGQLRGARPARRRRRGASSRCRAGTRVAIALPPGLDFAVALHACLRLGAVAVPVDVRDPRAPRRGRVVIDAPLRSARARCRARRPTTSTPTALVVRTSGTSGEPKEVPLTYGNFLWSALGSAVALGLDPARALAVHAAARPRRRARDRAAQRDLRHDRRAARAASTRATRSTRSRGARITVVSVVATTLARLLDGGPRAAAVAALRARRRRSDRRRRCSSARAPPASR